MSMPFSRYDLDPRCDLEARSSFGSQKDTSDSRLLLEPIFFDNGCFGGLFYCKSPVDLHTQLWKRITNHKKSITRIRKSVTYFWISDTQIKKSIN
jgi:hypothetical protein